MKNSSIGSIAVSILLWTSVVSCTSDIPANHGKLDIKLFTNDSLHQPLIVGFGGSEGGNAWSIDYWKGERDKFIQEGYAFMAIGYFGSEGIPSKLDRISLNAIRDSIVNIAMRHPSIDPTRITLLGGSKGGELVLNLASHFDDFTSVIAIVPSHVSFPALTIMANTSSWSLYNEELPYVPATWDALPSTLKRDFHEAFSLMLEDSTAVRQALIPVQNINGSVLLLSATNDEMWPSTKMCEQIIARLDSFRFPHRYKHIAVEGGHAAPLDHFDLIHAFLKESIVN
jgi:dienelactone hydrolase